MNDNQDKIQVIVSGLDKKKFATNKKFREAFLEMIDRAVNHAQNLQSERLSNVNTLEDDMDE